MKSTGKNHPWERIFTGRDEISIAEGSAFLELPLGEILNPTTFRIDPKRIGPKKGLTQKESKIGSIGGITDELYSDHKRKY